MPDQDAANAGPVQTADERAAGVVMDWCAKFTWGYDPNQHVILQQLFADAISEAEAAMKERCAAYLETAAEEHVANGQHKYAVPLREVAAELRNLE